MKFGVLFLAYRGTVPKSGFGVGSMLSGGTGAPFGVMKFASCTKNSVVYLRVPLLSVYDALCASATSEIKSRFGKTLVPWDLPGV